MVSLALAKQQLRYDEDAEDELIQQKIDSAIAYVEGLTGKWLTRREEVKEYDTWGHFIPLPRPDPVVSAVSYYDSDFADTVYEDYEQVGWRLKTAGCWPDTEGSIRVTVTAGYEEGEVPSDLIEAVLVHVRLAFDELRTGDGGNLGVVAQVCRRHWDMAV